MRVSARRRESEQREQAAWSLQDWGHLLFSTVKLLAIAENVESAS